MNKWEERRRHAYRAGWWGGVADATTPSLRLTLGLWFGFWLIFGLVGVFWDNLVLMLVWPVLVLSLLGWCWFARRKAAWHNRKLVD